MIDRYLIPELGTIPLTALRPDHVQRLYSRLLDRGLSPRTVNHCHVLLKEALGHAVKWQLAVRNICDAVDAPRPTRKEMVALDTDGVDRFLDAAEGSEYRDMFFVAIYTGLRRSEALGLRWPEMDLDRGAISIVAGLHRLKGKGLVLLPTKSHRSRRQVVISSEVVTVLRQIRARQAEQRLALGPVWQDTGFVFTKLDGRPFDPEKVSNAFASSRGAAGLEGVRLHDLRHTHASIMLRAGVHPKVV